MENLTFEQLTAVIIEIKCALERIEAKLSEPMCRPESEDKLMSISDAAEFVDLAVSTIYSKVSRMEIPVIKKGKKLYFERAVLLEWIKTGRRKTGEQIMASSLTVSSKSRERRR